MLQSAAPEASPSPTFDAGISAELDRIEAAIAGIDASLKPLWTPARTTPAVARVVAEAMGAMVDLRLQHGAIEERLRI